MTISDRASQRASLPLHAAAQELAEAEQTWL
jgi:hypothetical protein